MIGTKLAQYEIIEELGQGGMATVYRAYQPRMDRYVAVKVIRQSIIEDTNTRQRFQREARIIARLEHPHLLPVHDFDSAHKPPYIVMRYLEGGTLKEALTGQRLPFDEITYLLRQVGSALDYAHRQGVIHRDIKPSNIMIDQEGNAFVMDFGIARMTGRDSADAGLTGTGTIIGTPDYMAPEQGYATTEIGLSADIYSLGIMLFEMTTGQLPFKGASPMETMMFHLTKPVPRASDLNPELPAGLDDIFKKALAKEPADRYPSVIEFTAEVVNVLGDSVAATPYTLQKAAQESVSLVADRRAGLEDQIEATMAEFAAARVESAQATGPAQQHRTVTALYADAAEYNVLVEMDQGPEVAHQSVQDLWVQTAGIVDSHGGLIISRSDREMLAMWGAVSAREDDPERAVLASLEVRGALETRIGGLLNEDEPLPIGIGLNTGPALIAVDDETDSYTSSGATVSLANKIAGNADGRILITQDIYRHVQGVFEMEEDRPLRVRRPGGWARTDIYHVKDAKPRAFRLQPRGVGGVDTRMIGRLAELEELRKAFYTAVEDSETQAVTVVSDPGLGKSRLLYEFAAWAELRPEKFFIFRGRATPAMTNRPYALWRDILSFRFEILDGDRPDLVQQKTVDGVSDLVGHDERLAHLMGYLAGFDFGESPHLKGEPQDLASLGHQASIEFFKRLTERDPVVVQLEDLHHADDLSLDLLFEVASTDSNLPLLIVAMARPSLYQTRPTWGSGQDYHIRLDLRPLSKRDSRDLVSEILQNIDDVPRELRELLVERSEGNPYYMEELVKMLLEDKVIQKVDPERWTVETSRLKGLRVPPTLVSLLQARFDSLLYPEKLTLQRAAVVGRLFYDSAVSALDAADQTHVDNLGQILEALTVREFIYPRESSAFDGSAEYIFGQAMMRDLILETLLDRQVKTYHKAAAQWLSVQSGERSGEYEGLIAEHYEAAGEYLLAANYLYGSIKAAFKVGAYQEGISAGHRALDLLANCEPGSEKERQQLKTQMILADIHGYLGDYDIAVSLLESALTTARQIGDRATEASALAHLGRISGTFQRDLMTARSYLLESLEINKELDDKPGLMFILRQLGNVTFLSGDYEAAEIYLRDSLALSRKIGDLEGEASALNSLAINADLVDDFDGALALYQEGLEAAREAGDSLMAANIISGSGYIYAWLGDFDTAKRLNEEALAVTKEAGSKYLMHGCYFVLAWVAVEGGEYNLARQHLNGASKLALSLGNIDAITFSVFLGAWLEALDGDINKALSWLGLVQTLESSQRSGAKRFLLRIIDRIRGGLSDSQIKAQMEEGINLSLDDIVEEIIEKTGKRTESH